MENNQLQQIWKAIDKEFNYKSQDELKLLLESKAKQAYSEFLLLNVTVVPVSIGVIIWLIISAANRPEDKLYVANNILLGIILLFALFYGIREWNRVKRNKKDKPVREWLETEINFLSEWLTGKYKNLNFYLIPVLYFLTFLSIHVYYSELQFLEVFYSKKFVHEDLWGIVIFTPLLFAGLFYGMKKLRKHQIKKLQFLKDLHSRLCNVR